MRVLFFTIVSFLFITPIHAADLVITNANSGTAENPTVYDGGNYDQLIIDGASYITVQNSSFLKENTEQGWTTAVVDISNSDHIIIINCDIDGLDTGTVDYAACLGVGIGNSDYITIEDCTISQIADDPIAIGNTSSNITLRGNVVTEGYSCGTDGGCGPCNNGHTDGIETWDTNNLLIEDNFIFMEDATSCLITGGTNTNLIIRNNVFYAPGSGFVAYIYNTINGAKIYNNTFWEGQYGGIALGGDSVNDIYIYNNILHNIHYNHFGGAQQPDHYINNNLLGNTGYGYTPNTSDIVESDPEFTVAPALFGSRLTNPKKEDFQLTATSPAINKGATAVNGLPDDDISGALRDGSPDLGAWEFEITGSMTQQLPVSAVTASSNDGNVPENAIDDNLNTRWSAEGDGEWIEFDLGVELSLSEVHIAFHNGDQRAATFDIQTSSNKDQWETIFSGTSSGTTVELEQYDIQPASTARYVKIVGHGNSENDWNSITEVVLMGNDTGEGQLLPPSNFRVLDQ